MRAGILTAGLVLTVGCSGSGESAEPTTTTVPQPAVYSAIAVEAVEACLAKIAPGLGAAADADGDNYHTDTLDDAIATCETAEQQLIAEGDVELREPLHAHIRFMTLEALGIMAGGYLPSEAVELDQKCLEFTELARAALDAHAP